MIVQKLLTCASSNALHVVCNIGLFLNSPDGLRPVWQLPAGSKASLLAVGAIGQNFAILADSLKQVYLVKLADGTISQQCRYDKCPTSILIEEETEDSVLVLVADRFGDVTRLTFSLTEGVISAQANVIVGHVSVVTDMIRSDKTLVTADRDEKIRISSLEEPCPIQAFLLGHTEYVASVCQANASRLVSVSGDGTARLWGLDAEGSDSSKNLRYTFTFESEDYGRKIRVERVVSKSQEGEGEEENVVEEVEEVELTIVEPFEVVGFKDCLYVSFDRLDKLCVLQIQDDKLVFLRNLTFPQHQIISMTCDSENLLVLTYNEGFFLATQDSSPAPLELDAEATKKNDVQSWIDAHWKGGMRKDCHGLFAKRTKSKRAAEQEHSDLDDDE